MLCTFYEICTEVFILIDPEMESVGFFLNGISRNDSTESDQADRPA